MDVLKIHICQVLLFGSFTINLKNFLNYFNVLKYFSFNTLAEGFMISVRSLKHIKANRFNGTVKKSLVF